MDNILVCFSRSRSHLGDVPAQLFNVWVCTCAPKKLSFHRIKTLSFVRVLFLSIRSIVCVSVCNHYYTFYLLFMLLFAILPSPSHVVLGFGLSFLFANIRSKWLQKVALARCIYTIWCNSSYQQNHRTPTIISEPEHFATITIITMI